MRLKSQGEFKGKILANACPGPSTTCSVSVVLATNPPREQSQDALGWSRRATSQSTLTHPAPAKHPHYTPITSKPTTGGTGCNPPLSANLSHPTSLINSGQMGIWPYPTQEPSVKHWKIQIYPEHWSEAKEVLHYSSHPFVLLPEMEFITRVLWHREIYGQQTHSIHPKETGNN